MQNHVPVPSTFSSTSGAAGLTLLVYVVCLGVSQCGEEEEEGILQLCLQ